MTAGIQGQRHRCVYRLRRQKRVLITLSSRSEAANLTTSVAPTRRDRPKVDTFCDSVGAKDPAVPDKSRQKRLQ